MAEVFGIVTGAMSVAFLFNNCVECFEYAQFGRAFEEDFGRYRARLTISHARFTRWGKVVGVNDDDIFQDVECTDTEVQAIRESLAIIHNDFKKAFTASKRFEGKAKRGNMDMNTTVLKDNEMQPTELKAHVALRDKSRLRQKIGTWGTKFTWAIYEKKSFESLIDSIAQSIDDLEELKPSTTNALCGSVQDLCRQSAATDIEGIQETETLDVLREAAGNVDEALIEAVMEKQRGMSNITTGAVQVTTKGRNRIGDDIAAGYRGPMIISSIDTGDVTVAEEARNHIGNIYGGSAKGVFDD